jgi:hypothetical protein
VYPNGLQRLCQDVRHRVIQFSVLPRPAGGEGRGEGAAAAWKRPSPWPSPWSGRGEFWKTKWPCVRHRDTARLAIFGIGSFYSDKPMTEIHVLPA